MVFVFYGKIGPIRPIGRIRPMIEAIIFLFGSAVGSFLNVVILRLPSTGLRTNRSGQVCRLGKEESIIRGRSHCPKCGQVLAWYDLAPLVSFFMLRGRCRACQEKISWQYPLVEIATGLLFLLIFNFQFSIFDFAQGKIFNEFSVENLMATCFLLYVTCSLVVIFVYDLRHYIIPDVVLFPAVVVAAAYRIFDALAINSSQPPLSLRGGEIPPLNLRGGEGELLINVFMIIWPYLLAALAAAAFFLFLVLVTRGRGMGLGDVKLSLLMGLVLGWPNILIALFLAFGLGALVGVSLILLGKKTLKSQIPFGPFLVAGALAALFWGQQIIGFYFRHLVELSKVLW